MTLSTFFQLTPAPPDTMTGFYSLKLVALSYFIAFLASYVALDITERIRSNDKGMSSKFGWLIGGAFAMGMGIWTMHFIGMLAFIMPMPMGYDLLRTILSMMIAVICSGFAFFLIKNEKVKLFPLIMGGILLGLGIASMHYMGMSAMLNVHIHYLPSLFFLSIGIAIAASEAALWLMIQSSKLKNRYHFLMKIGSALIMGIAICGMHYTGMAAALFTHVVNDSVHGKSINPNSLSLYIAASSIIILSIALVASRFWMNALQSRNQLLIETQAKLEEKKVELEKLNQSLANLAENSIAREEKITAILTAAADGIIVTDENGWIEICNRAACEIFGYSSELVIGKPITHFIGKVGTSRENKFRQMMLKEFFVNKNLQNEFNGLHRNQFLIPLEVNASKSLISNKLLYIFVFRDITSRKKEEENLKVLNQKLVTTARLAGMSEVAACVLHNVGNVLNSITTSAQILLERDSSLKIEGFAKAAELVSKNKNNFNAFFKLDPIGKNFPEYLTQLAQYWKEEHELIRKEIELLHSKTNHIKNIVMMQNLLSGNTKIIEKTQINHLLDDALAINADLIEKHQVKVSCEYDEIPLIDLDKIKMLQVFVNLIKNSLEALIESKNNNKTLKLITKAIDDEKLCIQIIDNGIGIKPENLNKIFTFGFTTKKQGHGFGLHSSSLLVQEVGGSLKVYSEGTGQGATFELIMPQAQIKEEKASEKVSIEL